MEAFATYILKSVTWLTGFALVYLLFLRNERYFMLKRVYLIAGIFVSFLFPLISIHYQVDIPAPAIDRQALLEASAIPVAQITPDKPFDFRLYLMLLYLTGVLILGFKIIRQAGSLFRTINEEKTEDRGEAKLVRAKLFPVSFSFFNYIFINPAINGEELKAIINHELVHVRQKHWFDLLLAEILSILQWMNPFVWIYTGFIKMNHEYLADQEALRQTSSPANYKAVLLNQLFGAPVISLSNSFNYSVNKRRFDMMKMKITSPYRKMKMLFIVPVLATIFYAFATPEYHYLTGTNNVLPQSETVVTTPGIIQGIVVDEDNKPLAGVNIVVTGTYSGSVTDASGKFIVADVPEDASMVISGAGYLTQFIRAEFPGEIEIKLIRDPEYKSQPPLRTFEFGGKPAESDDSMDEAPFVIVEEMPAYPGGDRALLQFIAENTKYPEDAKSQNIQGRVILRFYVTREGNVGGISVMKGVHPSLDAEAVRVVSMLKGFSPGRQGGIAVNTWFSVPITFTLDTEPDGGDPEGKIVPKTQTTESSGKVGAPDPPEKLLAQGIPGEIRPKVDGSVEGILGQSGPQAPVLSDEPFVIVEQMPSYPGGDIELLNFIAANTQYPEEAKVANIQGRVIVRFIVTKDGRTADASVIKGVDPLLDEEALRVVNNLGDNWIPGQQGGVPVDVWFSVPISFTLK